MTVIIANRISSVLMTLLFAPAVAEFTLLKKYPVVSIDG
jgi:hypothetical protein